MRLTLRTLLAYLDDTLPPDEAKLIGQKVADSNTAQELIDKIKSVTRRRRLSTPPTTGETAADANMVAEYLSDALNADDTAEFEQLCLDSDVNLAEVAACHQILTLLLSEPARVPPTARQRMYRLVTGPESLPNRKPGNTIPIGGIMPVDENATIADAAANSPSLMGLPAFGRAPTRSTIAGKILLGTALLLGFFATVYFFSPNVTPPETGPLRELAAVAPKAPMPEPAPPVEPQPAPMSKPKTDAPTPTPTTPPMGDDAKPADNGPPAPKSDRITIGKVDNPDRILLTERAGKWLRVMPAEPNIFSAERLIALPGYKVNVTLASGPRVELWGNLPDQMPIGILESSLTFHLPNDGFSADLTLHAGRIYLDAKQPNTKIRVRGPKGVWDLTLIDNTTDLVIELTTSLPRGLLANVDATDQAIVGVGVAVLKGSAKMSSGTREITLGMNDSLYWSSKSGLQGPKKLANTPPFRDSAYFSKFPISLNEVTAKAVQTTLNELSSAFQTPDSLMVRLAELRAEKVPSPDETRAELVKTLIMKPRVAVLTYAAAGSIGDLIEALYDPRHEVRVAGVYGLLEALPLQIGGPAEFAKILQEKYRESEANAQLALGLLRGLTEDERRDAKALDTVVEQLASSSVAVRELAHWVLLNDVDPEARSVKLLSTFDATGTADSRDGVTKAWKRRVDELKKKFGEMK